MRLLTVSDGDIHLTDDLLDHEVPPYAILSHTWGRREHEVTYKDMVQGAGRDKPGYQKIVFCSDQAAKDGLQHFWVDSCCIDKSSSAELQEALSCMFRWYQTARACYVYLADVSAVDQHNRWTWEQAFRGSRWFTRGWTLQELLAPPKVEFFSHEGKLLGSKEALEELVQDITEINRDALRGAPVSQFSVEERLRWARHRHTTRPEDEAYSLLGIFGVFMPIIYGEGRRHATDRLRLAIKQRTENADWSMSPLRESGGPSPDPSKQSRTGSSRLDLPEDNPDARPYSLNDMPALVPDAEWSTSPYESAGPSLTPGQSRQSWTDRSTPNSPNVNSDATALPRNEMPAPGPDDILSRWRASRTLRGHKNSVSAVAFGPNDTLASASYDSTIKLWNSRTGQALRTLKGHCDGVEAVAFGPDGKLASGSLDHTVKLWDTRSGKLLRTLEGHQDTVNAVAFSQDGGTLASVSYGTLLVWDHPWRETGSHGVHSYIVYDSHVPAAGNTVSAVAFSISGSALVLAFENNTVKILDRETGSITAWLSGERNTVNFLPPPAVPWHSTATPSKWGPVVSWDAGSERTLPWPRTVWHAQSGEGFRRGKLGSTAVNAVAFSPDTGIYARKSSFSGIELRSLWDLQAKRILGGHRADVNAVAFSPDGRQLATGSDDHTVMVWMRS